MRAILVTFTAGLLFMPVFLSHISAAETVPLEGGALSSHWEKSTGRMVGLECKSPGYPGMVFVDSSLGAGGFEVYDELEGRLYTDRADGCSVDSWRVTDIGAFRRIEFKKRWAGAPFVLDVVLTGDVSGLRLEMSARLEKQPDGRFPRQRNIRVSFVLPAVPGLLGWAAAWPEPANILNSPRRYCYGIQEPGLPRTGIPMYTLYAPGRAGLSIAVPLDLPKVQLNMGPEPEDPSGLYVGVVPDPPAAEATLSYVSDPVPLVPAEIRVVRATELLVGLAADRPLRFAVRLFGHAPHWRPALGALVAAYPDYFRMDPGMRALWGARQGANVHLTEEDLASFRRYGGTVAWLHTHFHRHGDFIPAEAVSDPGYTWFCEPYAKDFFGISVNSNRAVIDRITDNGQGVFLYGFNMHADTISIIRQGLFADITRNRGGTITQAYHDQPVMFFHPRSPFGAHQLTQMDLMLGLYPRIRGVALDNWAYGGIDFAHDDGITMFGHRPAANVNFSQQRMIPAIAEKWHSSGRLVMVNKSRTIESMKGADSMLSEAAGEKIFAMFAYQCLDRHLHPTEYSAANDPEYAEYTLKYTFEWGGQVGGGQADPEAALAYGELMRGARNRTWVFDPDPLTMPVGVRGNIFRIHPDSPWDPGDIVVTLVRPEVRMRERRFIRGARIKVRLPEGVLVKKASWLMVEDYLKGAVRCDLSRNGGELTISLPALGAAGLLRLETDK